MCWVVLVPPTNIWGVSGDPEVTCGSPSTCFVVIFDDIPPIFVVGSVAEEFDREVC